jgi:GT2 family glycosyltransferase
MALIAMAVWDTEENGRSELTFRTLRSLGATVNSEKHDIVIVDNNSCKETKLYLREWQIQTPNATVLHCENNIGTARAINLAWYRRDPSQHVIKMDNDVVIHYENWVEEMEKVIAHHPEIGIVGLKRKDLEERPDHANSWYKSSLVFLPHKPGERWYVIELVHHVMGTCQMYSSALLEKIGYLYQPGLYGFDDSLASIRAHVAGFKTAFLPWIEIDHIDPGRTAYTTWKQKYSGKQMAFYNYLRDRLTDGRLPVYFDMDDDYSEGFGIDDINKYFGEEQNGQA